MKHLIQVFRTEEEGNSAVDWMVLTTGALLLGTAVLATVVGGGQRTANLDTQTVVSAL